LNIWELPYEYSCIIVVIGEDIVVDDVVDDY
jgi:hypothetical protein